MELSFYQIVRFAAPNIMVGNTILLKHASMVPQCGIAMEELFKRSKLRRIIHQSIDFGKKKYRFSDERIKGVSLTIVSEAAGSSMAGCR
jgi:succinate-semialdehyde dehydrogenase/glutarate-semialdehyde dehydrogenase